MKRRPITPPLGTASVEVLPPTTGDPAGEEATTLAVSPAPLPCSECAGKGVVQTAVGSWVSCTLCRGFGSGARLDAFLRQWRREGVA